MEITTVQVTREGVRGTFQDFLVYAGHLSMDDIKKVAVKLGAEYSGLPLRYAINEDRDYNEWVVTYTDNPNAVIDASGLFIEEDCATLELYIMHDEAKTV